MLHEKTNEAEEGGTFTGCCQVSSHTQEKKTSNAKLMYALGIIIDPKNTTKFQRTCMIHSCGQEVVSMSPQIINTLIWLMNKLPLLTGLYVSKEMSQR